MFSYCVEHLQAPMLVAVLLSLCHQYQCEAACTSYLAGEAYVGVCHPDGLDLLIYLIIRLVQTPHKVCNNQRGTAGHALRAVDQHLAIARPGSLQLKADLGCQGAVLGNVQEHMLHATQPETSSTAW